MVWILISLDKILMKWEVTLKTLFCKNLSWHNQEKVQSEYRFGIEWLCFFMKEKINQNREEKPR